MVTLGKYAIISSLSTMGVIYHAFHTREQFYPAMLYLSTSKISVVILGNMAFVLTLLFGQLLKTIFLGTLREAEVERLYELSRQEIMETCLAMTIFRDEFNSSFLAMFTALLFIKIFHWLSQKRIEYIETTPTVSRLSHVRIVAFMVLLFIVDCIFFKYAVTHAVSHTMKNKRPSVLVLFAFEYFILASSTVATFLKYTLYVADVVMDGQWDNKAVYIFYLELIRDLLHLFVYLVFFLIVFVYYGLPLHLVRDLYETFRNFRSRVADFIRYRRITSNLNDRFQDATPEELSRGDATCIICREEMTSAKKLPCGHLFHVHCLRSWLERQQTCPTCRSPLLAPENEAANGGANAGRQQQPLQPGAQGGQAGAAQVVNGQFHAPQHVHVLGQYAAPGPHGAEFHAQMQAAAAAAAAAQWGMAAMYPPWRQGAPNWYPAGIAGQQPHQQHQQQQQQQQQLLFQHPLLHQYPLMPQPFLLPMAAPAPTAPAEGSPANGAAASSDPQPAGPSAAGPGSANQDAGSAQANSFGRPVNFASLHEAQAQIAARLQMQASLAAAWTAQAQAQLAMGGWPYAGLPLYGMYPHAGLALNPGAAAGGPRPGGGEPTGGTEGAGAPSGERPGGAAPGGAQGGSTGAPAAPANLAQMLMQLQYQALSQLNPQVASSQAGMLRPAGTQQAQQPGPQPPAGSHPSPQSGGEPGTGQVAAAEASSEITTASAPREGGLPPEPESEASTSEVETLRQRRLKRYQAEPGREGSGSGGEGSGAS